MIAEIYGVNKSRVKYKRRKYNISFKNKINNGLCTNKEEKLINSGNIEILSKAIAFYILKGDYINEDDSELLCKYTASRLAGLLTAAIDGKWVQLNEVLNFYIPFGENLGKVEPDMKEINDV